MPPSTSELLELHARALFIHDAAGRITRVNEPGGARAPRCFCTRAVDGSTTLYRVRDDVPADPPALASLRADGPAYTFPPDLPTSHAIQLAPTDFALIRDLGWTDDEFPRDYAVRAPLFAILHSDRAISLCFTARLTAHAAEAGVTTHPDHRGRNHAGSVVAAWARAIRATDRIPLYSTSWTNTASQSVARKLGLVQYASDFSLPDGDRGRGTRAP